MVMRAQSDAGDPATIDYKLVFFVKDFLAATATMTGPEAAAYALSLLLGWTQGATLPADPERLRRSMRYDKDEWAKVWPVINEKWLVVNQRRANRRLSKEWRTAHENYAKWSSAGRDGGLKTQAARRASTEGTLEGTLETRAQRKGTLEGTLEEGAPNEGSAKPPRSRSSTTPSPTGKGEAIFEEHPARKRAARSPFVEPSKKEISEYAVSMGWSAADWSTTGFFLHYATKGWMVGKVRMKDWHLAAQKAHREGWTTKQGTGGNGSAVVDPEAAKNKAEANDRSLAEAREKMRRQGMHPDG